MSARLKVGAIAAFLAIVTGVVWLALAVGREGNPTSDALAPAVAEVDEPPSDEPHDVPLNDVIVEAVPSAARSERVAAGVEFENAIWIDGRVIVPPHTPRDEHVMVVGAFADPEDRAPAKAPIDAHGRFRVAFPPGFAAGALNIDARWLRLEEEYDVDLVEPADDILLEPVLGGRVHGRLHLSAKHEGEREAVVGLTLNVMSVDAGERDSRASLSQRIASSGKSSSAERGLCTAFVDHALELDIGPLPNDIDVHITSAPGAFLPIDERVHIVACETYDLDIVLHAGGRVYGRIIDASGAPIVSARINWLAGGGEEDLKARMRRTLSQADGNFALFSIPPGPGRICVEADGFLAEERSLGEIVDGDVREGLDFTLRTSVVSGRVQWPDGSAAVGCEVYLETVLNGTQLRDRRGMRSNPGVTDEQGAFRIEFENDVPCDLFARSSAQGLRSSSVSTKVGDTTPRKKAVAHVDGVHPGGEPLLIVLEEPASLEGRVVDERGSPVQHVDVSAQCSPRPSLPGFDAYSALSDAVGRFTLQGMFDGRWTVIAMFKSTVRKQSVEIPHSGAPIEIVLPRPSSVRGIVVDPSGNLAAGARVTPTHGQGRSLHQPRAFPDGRFSFEGLESGTIELRATSHRWAESEPQVVELKPGEDRDGVTLKLRPGGAVEVGVLDEHEKPMAGHRVMVTRIGGRAFSMETTTNPSGHCTIGGLLAGRYAVHRAPTTEEMAMQSVRNAGTTQHYMGAGGRAAVAIVEGETAHVVLRGLLSSPIRVHGRIARSAMALSVHSVKAFGRDFDGIDFFRSPVSASGAFELDLFEPGEYIFVLESTGGACNVSYSRTLPDTTEASFEFVLPTGTVSGLVRGRDGRALGGVYLELQPDQRMPGADGSIASGKASTSSDGRFEFRGVPGGSYTLIVPQPNVDSEFEEPSIIGKKIVLSDGETLKGVELTVP